MVRRLLPVYCVHQNIFLAAAGIAAFVLSLFVYSAVSFGRTRLTIAHTSIVLDISSKIRLHVCAPVGKKLRALIINSIEVVT